MAAFVAEHVWEHMPLTAGAVAAANAFAALRPGGYLRVAVPDSFKPGSNRPPALSEDIAYEHAVRYNYRTLSALLEGAGFVVTLLEWHDDQGKFRCRR